MTDSKERGGTGMFVVPETQSLNTDGEERESGVWPFLGPPQASAVLTLLVAVVLIICL